MAQPVGLGMKRNKEKSMKHLIIGLAIELTLGLVCSAYAITKRTFNSKDVQICCIEEFSNASKVFIFQKFVDCINADTVNFCNLCFRHAFVDKF